MGSKYTKLRLRPKLRPGPCWGVYNAPSQDSWMDLRGPLRVGREGQSAKGRREGRGWDGKGNGRGSRGNEGLDSAPLQKFLRAPMVPLSRL